MPYSSNSQNLGFSSNPWMNASNPFVDQQAGQLAQQSNQAFTQNVLPSLNSGAMASGGFGGSRQGIAQGLAAQGQQQSLNNAMTNLYANAYNTNQQLANQYELGRMQNDTAQRGQDISFDLGTAQNANQRYGIDQGNATQRYGIDQNNSTQRYGLDLNNTTQRYGIDQNNSLQRYMNDQNNETTRYGIDKGVLNAEKAANAAMAASYNNAGASMFGSRESAAANRYATDINSANQMAIAQMQNNLGFGQLNANIYNNDFNNSLNAARFGLDAYTSMQNSNNNALTNANGMYNTPINYSNYFTNAFNQAGGLGGSSSQTGQGNPLLGALGGAAIGNRVG